MFINSRSEIEISILNFDPFLMDENFILRTKFLILLGIYVSQEIFCNRQKKSDKFLRHF